MKVTDLAISYKTSIGVLTALVVVGGTISYVKLPKESSPSIAIPYIVVTTIYPGASPSDIENLLTQPIEREVQGINGIDNIRSTSVEGVSSIVVEFTPDISIDDAKVKVREKVDQAKPDLPSDVEDSIVSEIDLSEFPIMNINLAADYSLSRLKEVAEDLQDALEAIPSVLEVSLVGGLEREVQVDVDLVALQAYNLKLDDLTDTIRKENANIPGGSVDVDRLNFMIRVDGQFSRPEEIEDLLIKAPNGRPVYIRDVATVKLGFKDRESYARLRELRRETDGVMKELDDGQYRQVLTLGVKKRSGLNILETSEAVDKVLKGFQFPTGTQVLITGDQSRDVRSMVTDLENNIISGLIFVVGVLLFFLGVRNSVLVGVAIPLSMYVSFAVFMAMGQTLNFIILFSLIIALGMLVDNAIVIVENIYRYREEGHTSWEAARKGTSEVGVAVTSSTLTTVAAFLPMLFWPGIIGEFMGYMPLTLIITLSSSLFVALIINPVLTGYFVRVKADDAVARVARSPWIKRIALVAVVVVALMIGLTNPTSLGVLAVGGLTIWLVHHYVLSHVADRFSGHTLPRVVNAYRKFIGWMLERDYSVRRPYLRNGFALGCLAVGGGLLVMAGATALALGANAAYVLAAPGGLFMAVGLLATFFHTIESIVLGGWTSVKVGLGFGAVMFTILAIMYVSPRPLEVGTILELMMMPAIVVVFGIIGGLVLGNGRKTFILTDNRARLLTGSLGALFSILGMFAVAPTGVAFFPDTDPNQIQVVVEGPLGMNLEASNQLAMTAQARIAELLQSKETEENIENILVNVGVGGDASFGGGSSSPERTRIVMNLVSYGDRSESSSDTLGKVRDRIQGIAGAQIEIEKDRHGPPTGPPVNIEISGPDFQEIIRISEEVKGLLTKGVESGAIKGLVDVRDNLNTGRPELKVRIDRQRAAQFGLDTSLVARTIRTAYNGEEASKFRTGEDEYDITVRLAPKYRQSLDSIKNITIEHEGAQVPLVAVAELEVGSGLGSITRLDGQRVVTVLGSAAPGFNGPDVLKSAQEALKGYDETVPPGYKMKYTGENKDQEESFSFLTTALFVGSALIFMILIAQFNSISGPFIIMVAVGLSLIGVLLGLILTRTPFGLFSFIGIISLAGIVVNNNIVLIDYAMQLRARGMGKREAIIEAGATRLRPVLLTAMTTVLGLIPLTFGINVDFVGLLTKLEPDFQLGSENTQFWGPMGTAIIAGLTFATFLTLVIVPVMYSLFDSVSRKGGELMGWDLEEEPTPAAPKTTAAVDARPSA